MLTLCIGSSGAFAQDGTAPAQAPAPAKSTASDAELDALLGGDTAKPAPAQSQATSQAAPASSDVQTTPAVEVPAQDAQAQEAPASPPAAPVAATADAPAAETTATAPAPAASKPKPYGVIKVPQGEAKHDGPPKRQIEEIVVTVQKQEQSLQDVPVSVSALSGNFMRELGANNLPSIASYLPNVRFSSDSDPVLAQVNIRGFGSSPLNAAFESSVGFVEDDIFFGRPTYFNEAVFDIARVEVLRGPQGTLFGKNTSAGLFNIVSKSPTQEFSGDIRTSYDPTAKERRIEGGIGGMFSEWGGIRISGLDISRGGDLLNTKLNRMEDQQQQQAGRIKVLLLPMDDLRMELTAVHSSTSITYWPLQLYKLTPGTRTYLQQFDPKVEDDPYNHQMSADFAGYLNKNSNTVGLKSDYNLGTFAGIDDLKFTWVNGYSEIGIDSAPDGDQSPADVIHLHVISGYHQISSEPRFSGTLPNGLFGLGESLDFVVGAFYLKNDFKQDTTLGAGADFGSFLLTDSAARQISGQSGASSLPLNGLGAVGQLLSGVLGGVIGNDTFSLHFKQRSTTEAVFGQAIWHLSEDWTLTPGARFSREAKTANASSAANCRLPPACITEVALMGQAYDQSSDRVETDFSPKLALQYAVTDGINVFTSYSKGFKSGGLNAASFSGNGGNLVYGPENVTSYEFGVKSMLFDRTLTVNATAFLSDFKNLQVLNIQGAAITVSNAATATSKGIEADMMWLTPVEWLSLNASLGLLNARYKSYPNGPATIDMPKGSHQDLSGRPLTFAPNLTASLSPTIRFPVTGNIGAQFSVDALHQSSQYTNLDLDPNTLVQAHTTYSARFILASINGGWNLVLGGTNLSNAKVANQIINTTIYPGVYAVTQQNGRAVFGAISFNW